MGEAGVAGVDTLYIADDNATSGGLLKYSFDGTTWTARGSAGAAADAYRGLTTALFQLPSPGVTLYAVRKGGGTATGGGLPLALVQFAAYLLRHIGAGLARLLNDMDRGVNLGG